METRPLEAGDNRLAFSCGNESIDIYLREQALQDQERRFSVTYVATHEGEIVGYATSCVTVVEPDGLKKAVAKALPVRSYPHSNWHGLVSTCGFKGSRLARDCWSTR